MKNNKGFTLIELLAVITILAIILTLLIVSVNEVISDSKDSLHESQANQAIKAARMWYLDSDIILENNTSCKVSISDLSESGYIENNKVIDPSTGEDMTGYVVIKYKDNKYTYTFEETSGIATCTE